MSFLNTIGNSPFTNKVLESSRGLENSRLMPQSSFWRVSTNRKRVGHEGISSSGLHVWEMFPPRTSASSASPGFLYERLRSRWKGEPMPPATNIIGGQVTRPPWHIICSWMIYCFVSQKSLQDFCNSNYTWFLKSIVMVVKHINQSLYDQIIIIISPSVALAR